MQDRRGSQCARHHLDLGDIATACALADRGLVMARGNNWYVEVPLFHALLARIDLASLHHRSQTGPSLVVDRAMGHFGFQLVKVRLTSPPQFRSRAPLASTSLAAGLLFRNADVGSTCANARLCGGCGPVPL